MFQEKKAVFLATKTRVLSQKRKGKADISADDSTLFFASKQDGGSGGNDLWQVPIIPVYDFNGDGKVDSADISIMAGY